GVVEGSLTGLLVAYGMETEVALAAVLLYRAVSFWGLVPVGWAVWGYLGFKSKGRSERPQRRRVRPHPWAVHLHRAPSAVETPPRSAPDIVLPVEPCEGCDHEEDEEFVSDGSVARR